MALATGPTVRDDWKALMVALANIIGRRRLPLIYQTEAAECGLACLAMIATWHGNRIDLATLRLKHAISLKGATLAELIGIAADLQLTPRALRLDIQELSQLKLPAILHWDMNHFVVLREKRRSAVVIHDPARGERIVKLDEFSKHFTGIALELTPTAGFEVKQRRPRLRLSDLLGPTRGVVRGLSQVLALSLALQIVMLASPWFLQIVVDHVLLAADIDLLAVLGVGFGLLVILRAGIASLRSWMVEYISVNLSFQVLANLFRHLITLPMDFFLKRHIGDIVSRFTSVNVIQRTLTTTFVEALVDGVLVIITLAVMLLYAPLLTAVAVGAAIIYGLIRRMAFRRQREATEEQIVFGARKDSHLLETIRGTQSIRLFAREAQRHNSWQNLLTDTLNADVRVAKQNIAFDAASQVLFGIEYVAIVWLGTYAVIGSDMSVGMLLAFIAYRNSFSSAAGTLVNRVIEYRMLGLHLERVSDIALTKPDENSFVTNNPNASSEVHGHLVLDNVSFRYSGSESYVVERVNLEALPGESVAITGPSGCGKTTLMRIMLGLLRPTNGRVLIDGLDINRNGRPIRNAVTSVMQDNHLFAGSIAQNISFFDEQPSRDRIFQSAALAAIHDEIIAMPMGYETLVGDMGTSLSGGQKQRILLARALYQQPKLLFLDEATSHLDKDCEDLVNLAISRLGITRIIIAHREETLRSVDRVIRLAKRNSSPARKRESMETSGA